MKNALILVFLVACGNSSAPGEAPPKVDQPAVAQEVTSEKVEKSVAIADAVEKEPARADEILAEHGTDRATFEATLFEIAEDPALAAAYAKAREK